MIENQILDFIRNRQRELAVGLCEHPAEDHAKYNRQVGIYHGLQEVCDFINNFNNEEDDQR